MGELQRADPLRGCPLLEAPAADEAQLPMSLHGPPAEQAAHNTPRKVRQAKAVRRMPTS
jgi:hypothetical protein